mmetsp:Transcript_5213/g.6068  ORF Transcript_5213/g.6068 Transcript_5213/m.6068 type:complete len:289 (-) Transcript_5213:3-869(-)
MNRYILLFTIFSFHLSSFVLAYYIPLSLVRPKKRITRNSKQSVLYSSKGENEQGQRTVSLQESLQIIEKYSSKNSNNNYQEEDDDDQDNSMYFTRPLTIEESSISKSQKYEYTTTSKNNENVISETNNNSNSNFLINTLALGLGSYGASLALGDMLDQYEWFQACRYLWPFSIGGIFLLEGSGGIRILPFALGYDIFSKWIAIIGGFGLIVGGAYDAFMPVWMTGPNIITNAGINQDSAAVLLLLSIYSILTETMKKKDETNDLSPFTEQQQSQNSSDSLTLLLQYCY